MSKLTHEEKVALLGYYRQREDFWMRVVWDAPDPKTGEIAALMVASAYAQWDHYNTLYCKMINEVYP